MPNDAAPEILLDTAELPWIPMGGPGLWFRLLRSSTETGQWTVLIRMAKGASFAPHRHLGAAEFYVLRGTLHYRAGTARQGYYGYEPLGVIHEETAAEDETILWYNGYGPVAFTGPDGSIAGVLDSEWVRKAAEDHARSAKPAA